MTTQQAVKAVRKVLPDATVTVAREYSFDRGVVLFMARASASTGDGFGEGSTRGQALERMVASARPWTVLP